MAGSELVGGGGPAVTVEEWRTLQSLADGVRTLARARGARETAGKAEALGRKLEREINAVQVDIIHRHNGTDTRRRHAKTACARHASQRRYLRSLG